MASLRHQRHPTEHSVAASVLGKPQFLPHDLAQPAVRSIVAARFMPDHINRQRRKFDRNCQDSEPEPLFQQRAHACRKYAQQISAGHDGWYFKKLAHTHCFVHSQLIEFP